MKKRQKVWKLQFATFQKAAAFAKRKNTEEGEGVLIRRSGLLMMPWEVELNFPHLGFDREYELYEPTKEDLSAYEESFRHDYEELREELARERADSLDRLALSGEDGWYYDDEGKLWRVNQPDW